MSRTLWRLGFFVTVCAAGAFALIAIFGQLRFEPKVTYHAIFATVGGLEAGDFVRVAGVEVGKVMSTVVRDDGTVDVDFSTDDTVTLTTDTQAVIRYDDLIGGRHLALEKGAGGTERLAAGGTIPLGSTAPALDLDALIGGFRPLFRALDPDQVNALSSQLIMALLDQTAALTSTLADRDQLIGAVINNLNSVLGSFGNRSEQFGAAVDSLAELVHGLEARKQDLSNGVAYANAASKSIADLLREARPPLKTVLDQTDRSSSVVLADHEYVDNLLATLPDAYKLVGRQGLYGDFFSFYMCDLVLKLNGKGGQPTYVKVAGQSSGRCTPK
jgi:phospholipid/cholesterol/gamma-HCH transport system substrate-binding protein